MYPFQEEHPFLSLEYEQKVKNRIYSPLLTYFTVQIKHFVCSDNKSVLKVQAGMIPLTWLLAGDKGISCNHSSQFNAILITHKYLTVFLKISIDDPDVDVHIEFLTSASSDSLYKNITLPSKDGMHYNDRLSHRSYLTQTFLLHNVVHQILEPKGFIHINLNALMYPVYHSNVKQAMVNHITFFAKENHIMQQPNGKFN